MRKISALLAASAAALALALTGVASASAAPVAHSMVAAQAHHKIPLDFNNLGYCDDQATIECLYASGAGNNVYTKQWDSSFRDERFSLQRDVAQCNNGYVSENANGTSGCPFTDNTLNKLWKGWEIVIISAVQNFGCAVSTATSGSTSNVWMDSNCGNGTLWVLVPWQSGYNDAINVLQSDRLGTSEYLYEVNDNAVAITDSVDPIQGKALWQGHS